MRARCTGLFSSCAATGSVWEDATTQVVEIEATNLCNIRCVHCPREAITRSTGAMSWEVFQAIADKILAHGGVRAVDFSGMGEPTLNLQLPRFVAYLSGAVSTYLTTNASTLTPERVQALGQAGLQHVMVSFSGHEAGLYAQMTGGLDLEKADVRIRELVRSGGPGMHVAANVSVTPDTRDHLAEICDHLHHLGIQDVNFSLCHNRGGHLKDVSVCDTPLPPTGRGCCDIFAGTLFVAWNGQVLACCHDLHGEGVIGDLVTGDLATILDRKQRIVRQGVHFPMCEECNDIYRFAQDPTPDGRPLSEWIYLLAGSQGPGASKLMHIIRRQEARIAELEQLVAGYERGRWIRFTRWLHRVKRRLTRQVEWTS